jgi:inorganic pyrophosphatase
LPAIGDDVEVEIEVPRFGFVKRRADRSIDFVSPLPCPFNYGSILGRVAADGDPLDAVVLGARLARGTRVRVPVVAIVGFVDAGDDDPKIICSSAPLTARSRGRIARFFRVYAIAKRILHGARRRAGATRYLGYVA